MHPIKAGLLTTAVDNTYTAAAIPHTKNLAIKLVYTARTNTFGLGSAKLRLSNKKENSDARKSRRFPKISTDWSAPHLIRMELPVKKNAFIKMNTSIIGRNGPILVLFIDLYIAGCRWNFVKMYTTGKVNIREGYPCVPKRNGFTGVYRWQIASLNTIMYSLIVIVQNLKKIRNSNLCSLRYPRLAILFKPVAVLKINKESVLPYMIFTFLSLRLFLLLLHYSFPPHCHWYDCPYDIGR